MSSREPDEQVQKRGQMELDVLLAKPAPPQQERKAPSPAAASFSVEVVTMSDVVPEQVSWLWAGRIPRGKLTIFDGDPGVGKSTLIYCIAACVSTGQPLPGQSEGAPADVLLLSAEDGLQDTQAPRLNAAGADLSRVHSLPGLHQIPESIPKIEEVARAKAAALIVIDPLMAYLSMRANSHKDQRVRQALAPLSVMAERLGAAVLIVRHLNKQLAGPAMYRGGGSIGIIGAARSAMLVAVDPNDKDRRILASIKCNMAQRPPALSFLLQNTGQVARIEWLGECSYEADELTAPPAPGESGRALTVARDFLQQLLGAGASIPQREVAHAAAERGISMATLRRARHALPVNVKKDAHGWWWSLGTSHEEGDQGAQDAQDAQRPNAAAALHARQGR